ncbi:MAG: fatty acid desaturase [Marinicaulis sp.]|nr:fatty acid desaturase [Marinicaulis sp.]
MPYSELTEIADTGRPNEWLTHDERTTLTRKTTSEAVIILAAHYAFYFLSLAGALAPLPLIVNLICAVLNGLAIGLLFVIGHDCVHKAYAPTKILNQLMARLSFIPCAHSSSQWEVVHNRNHHGKTNFKNVDYVWAPINKNEYDAASPMRRFMERVYRSAWGPVIYYYIEFWLRRLLIPITKEMRIEWRRHLPDSIFILTALALTIAGILAAGKAMNPDRSLVMIFLVGWLLPFSIWNYLVALSTYLHHTHPKVHWFDKPEEWSFYGSAILGTTHVDLPFKWARLFSDVMEHTAHHALPSIPIYKLSDAQKLLLKRYGDKVVKYKFTIAEYKRILAACKLYDTERHCWTDFDGNPTGPFLEKLNKTLPSKAAS